MTPKTTLTCDCLGWSYRQTCKHSKAVEKSLSKGATIPFPLTFRSLTDPTLVYTVNRVPTGQESVPRLPSKPHPHSPPMQGSRDPTGPNQKIAPGQTQSLIYSRHETAMIPVAFRETTRHTTAASPRVTIGIG